MKKNLVIGWLYPELMNIYGDRGNIIVLEKRCRERGIETKTLMLDVGFDKNRLKECDLLIMGGAQDKQQEAVSNDLLDKKALLKELIENGVPGLYICGAFQFLGNYYKEANGNIIKGLGIFDLYTENPGEKEKRLSGNIAFLSSDLNYTLIGFENHGGRTYLGRKVKPFGKVIKGYGNNGADGFEGMRFNDSYGTYLHGPILPKNPKFADYLIEKALKKKYKIKTNLKKIDDVFEEKARITIAKRLSIAI
jgi:CobQ-like glutamine amidotransferase family enzyme